MLASSCSAGTVAGFLCRILQAFIIVFHPERNVRSTARRKSRDYGRKRSTGLNASAINKSGSAGRDTPLSSPTSQGRIGVLSSGGDACKLVSDILRLCICISAALHFTG